MSNNTIPLAPQDLTAAMNDVWSVFLEGAFLLSSFIPAILITIITAGLTSLLLRLGRAETAFVAYIWTLIMALGGHLAAIVTVHDYYIDSDPHPGWSVMMFQIYCGEILFNFFPVVVVAIGVGIKAVGSRVYRRYFGGTEGEGKEHASTTTRVNDSERLPLLR